MTPASYEARDTLVRGACETPRRGRVRTSFGAMTPAISTAFCQVYEHWLPKYENGHTKKLRRQAMEELPPLHGVGIRLFVRIGTEPRSVNQVAR